MMTFYILQNAQHNTANFAYSLENVDQHPFIQVDLAVPSGLLNSVRLVDICQYDQLSNVE